MDALLREAAALLDMGVFREALSSLAAFYSAGNGPSNAVLAAHFLFCSTAMNMSGLHDGGHRYLLSFWTVFMAACGGGTITALLMMRPDLAPIPAFLDTRLLPYLIATWYFAQYTYIGRLVMSVPPVRFACKLATTYCRAGLICGRAELAVQLYPGVYGAHLILGTLAGSGGKLLCDGILHGIGQLRTPAELSAPSWALRSGFAFSLIYLSFAHYLPAAFGLTIVQSRALVTTLLLLQATLSTLWGAEIDFTRPFNATFHALTGIPTYYDTPPLEKVAKGKTMPPTGKANSNAKRGSNRTSQKAAVHVEGSEGKKVQ